MGCLVLQTKSQQLRRLAQNAVQMLLENWWCRNIKSNNWSPLTQKYLSYTDLANERRWKRNLIFTTLKESLQALCLCCFLTALAEFLSSYPPSCKTWRDPSTIQRQHHLSESSIAKSINESQVIQKFAKIDTVYQLSSKSFNKFWIDSDTNSSTNSGWSHSHRFFHPFGSDLFPIRSRHILQIPRPAKKSVGGLELGYP